MSTREHAQQIYTALLAAMQSSGKPLPSRDETKKWVEVSMLYAKAFEDGTKEKPSVT